MGNKPSGEEPAQPKASDFSKKSRGKGDAGPKGKLKAAPKQDPISLIGKYTNADTSLFYLKQLGNLLSGDFRYTNLMLKNEAVNQKLRELNVPFVLKMGVLGDFHFKFSILTQRLEKIYINNLILFVQTKFHQESEYHRLSPDEQKVGSCF